jgi:hypothetical protein
MLVTYWEGFLILCGVLSMLDLWLRFGHRVISLVSGISRFIRRRKPRRNHKVNHCSAIWVEIDQKTKKSCIVHQYQNGLVTRVEDAGKVGDELNCPIKTAKAFAMMFGLKEAGINRWTLQHEPKVLDPNEWLKDL